MLPILVLLNALGALPFTKGNAPCAFNRTNMVSRKLTFSAIQMLTKTFSFCLFFVFKQNPVNIKEIKLSEEYQ